MAVDLYFAVRWRVELSSFPFRRLCLVEVLVAARDVHPRLADLTATELLGFFFLFSGVFVLGSTLGKIFPLG